MHSHCCHSRLASVCYRFSIPITLRVNTSCVTFSAVEHQPSLQSPNPQRSRSLYQPRHSLCHTHAKAESTIPRAPKGSVNKPLRPEPPQPEPQRSRPLAQPRRASVQSHMNTLTRCSALSHSHIAPLPTLKSQRPYVPVHSTITTASALCNFLQRHSSQRQFRSISIAMFRLFLVLNRLGRVAVIT